MKLPNNLPTYQFTNLPISSQQSCEPGPVDLVARENGRGVADTQMAYHDLAEHVTEIGRHGQVPSFVAALGREAGPASINAPAAHAAADNQHGVSMTVIGSAISILVHRAPELRHCQHDRILHAVAEIGNEGGDAAREIVEAGRELALCGALVHMRVPAADVRERNLEAHVRLREL